MFIDYIILGIISLGTLIWAFYTLPRDDESTDDNGGGTPAGGDTAPSGEPPALTKPSPESAQSGPSKPTGP